ncbi:MAG: hypothetical protein MHM6MM_006144 [Cercozoa sp. M6MM]
MLGALARRSLRRQRRVVSRAFAAQAQSDDNSLRELTQSLDEETKRRLFVLLSRQLSQQESSESDNSLFEREFARADVDKDGKLSPQEFGQWFRHGGDQLQQQASLDQVETESSEATVTSQQLRLTSLQQAVPFFGFGLFDNILLITFGEAVDMTVGAKFGLSTMAAAAVGNVFSDVFGVSLGGFIERTAQKLGLPDPHLTPAQSKLQSVRNARLVGSVGGVSVGCAVGMLPLLFFI